MHSARLLRFASLSTLLTLALWLSACKTTPPPPPPPPVAVPVTKPKGLYEWNGQDKAITSMQIHVNDQMAYLFNGRDQIGWTYVATGITSFPTPTGDFKVLEKVADKVSNLYGKGYDAAGKLVNSDFKQGRDLLPPGGRFEAAKMTYFMRLTGDGVGMHIGPIPHPGRRASHGCIRMPAKAAAIIFNHISVGTPVTITGNGPDYPSYLKQSEKKAKDNAAKFAEAKKKADEAAAAAAAAAAAMALPPGDPNGPATPASGTTPAASTPATTGETVPGAPAKPAPEN